MTKPHDLIPVDSSMIHGYSHDPDSRELTVQYKDKDGNPSSVWAYADVGADKVHTMAQSASPGRYFNDRIKGVHKGYKVS